MDSGCRLFWEEFNAYRMSKMIINNISVAGKEMLDLLQRQREKTKEVWGHAVKRSSGDRYWWSRRARCWYL
jgi:hypothetical protein